MERTILLSIDRYIMKSIVCLKEEMSTLRSPNKIKCHLFIGRRILQLRKWKNFNGHICTMSSVLTASAKVYKLKGGQELMITTKLTLSLICMYYV